jgi:restriction system protein
MPYEDVVEDVKVYAIPVAAVLLVILVVVAAVHLVMFICRVLRWRQVRKQLGVDIPFSTSISRAPHSDAIGSFALAYPRWSMSKRDGTHDRRSNNMSIMDGVCALEIGGWRIEGTDPFTFYDMINAIRAAGSTVGYSAEEQAKRLAEAQHMRSHRQIATIDGIIAQFTATPTDFEPFCADLFRGLGYTAQTTPPTRDGGFDIRLRREDGRTAIVECKCFDRHHHVGRPIIQKLIGANTVGHADTMMVVTTSSFSSDAIDFARDSGVELLDGNRLVALCQRVWGDALQTSHVPAQVALLTRNDLMAHIPADMRYQY